jgi:hypothetical protein
MTQVDGDAGLVTNFTAAYNELTNAANSFDEVVRSEESTASDIGQGLATWMKAIATFERSVGEGYEEDAENVAEMQHGEGVGGQLIVGGTAVAGAIAEGATQTLMTAGSVGMAISAELVEALSAIGGKSDEAFAQLEAGHPDAALHTLVDATWIGWDAVEDVAGQAVTGAGHTAVEAVSGLLETGFEFGEMAAEVTIAAIDAIRDTSGNDVLLLSSFQSQGVEPVTPAEPTNAQTAHGSPGEYNMDADAPVVGPLLSPDTVNMEQEANTPQVLVDNTLDTEIDPGYNPDEM